MQEQRLERFKSALRGWILGVFCSTLVGGVLWRFGAEYAVMLSMVIVLVLMIRPDVLVHPTREELGK